MPETLISGFNQGLRAGVQATQRNRANALRQRSLDQVDRQLNTQDEVRKRTTDQEDGQLLHDDIDKLYTQFNITSGEDMDRVLSSGDNRFRDSLTAIVNNNEGLQAALRKRGLVDPKITMISGEGGNGKPMFAIAGINEKTGQPGFITKNQTVSAENPADPIVSMSAFEIMQVARGYGDRLGGRSSMAATTLSQGLQSTIGRSDAESAGQFIENSLAQAGEATQEISERTKTAKDPAQQTGNRPVTLQQARLQDLQAKEIGKLNALGADVDAANDRLLKLQGYDNLGTLGKREHDKAVAETDFKRTLYRDQEQFVNNLTLADNNARNQGELVRLQGSQQRLSQELGSTLRTGEATQQNELAKDRDSHNATLEGVATAQKALTEERLLEVKSNLNSEQYRNNLIAGSEVENYRRNLDLQSKLESDKRALKKERSANNVNDIANGQYDSGNVLVGQFGALFGMDPSQAALDKKIDGKVKAFFSGGMTVNNENLQALAPGGTYGEALQRLTSMTEQAISHPVHGKRLARLLGYDYNEGAAEIGRLSPVHQAQAFDVVAAMVLTNAKRNLVFDDEVALVNDFTAQGMEDAYRVGAANTFGGVEHRTDARELQGLDGNVPSTERAPNASGISGSAGLTPFQAERAENPTLGRLIRKDGKQPRLSDR